MKRTVLLLILVFVCSTLGSSQVQVGSKIENFSLTDVDGASQKPGDIKGKNGFVLVFVSIQCPVVRGYDTRINELAKAYREKGINLIGVDSNFTESASEIKSHASSRWNFPVLLDPDSKLATQLGASVTPEAFYVDANDVLLYHGAVDNDRSGRNVTERYLQNAFDAALSGKKIERTTANAFGCSIKRAGQ